MDEDEYDVDEERLILEVQKYPQLYDVSHKYYKDNVRTDKLWRTISEEMDLPGMHYSDFWLATNVNQVNV